MLIRHYTIERDGQYWIVVDAADNCVAGPYETREQAERNMQSVCWGDTPEWGVEL